MADEVLGYVATHTYASGGQEQTVETPSLPFATFLDRTIIKCESAWNRFQPDYAHAPDEPTTPDLWAGPRPTLTMERPHPNAPDSNAGVETEQNDGETLAQWKRRFLADVQRSFAKFPPK